MQVVRTEYDEMMNEVMDFTQTVIGLSEMKSIPVSLRAEAIFMAEKIFHKVLMKKLIEKRIEKVVPCNN